MRTSRTVGRTIAVGGGRDVPVPDPIARDYILLGLRLDQRTPGLVDGYFGPADLKAQVDMEQLRSPARLRDNAAALRERLTDAVAEAPRRRWLDAQLVALETHAAVLAGATLPYVEHVTRAFDLEPVRRPGSLFVDAAAELDALVPGAGGIGDRLASWDARFVIPPDQLEPVVGWLVGRFRQRARALFGLPAGESLRIGLVRDQPWTGYNWYDGGGRSRVDLNVDLPIHAAELIRVLAHETYPGHHLEHAWKEAELVAHRCHLEASILLINTPECLISEGLANLGRRFVSPPEEEAELLVELYERADLAVAADAAGAEDAAQRQVRITRARDRLNGAALNAALLRHADRADHDEVQAYLERVALMDPVRAAKRLSFIEHPLWRTYQPVYTEGFELLARWLELVPPEDRATRFRRLLVEQLTPGAVEDEIAAAGQAGGPTSPASSGSSSSRTNTVRSSPSDS